MHNDFTLFTRKYSNGTKVVFYYAYDDDGVRVGPWTTGCEGKTAARNYCNQLLKKDMLVPGKGRIETFGDFAVGFWDRGSVYVENQDGRADITDSYLWNCRKMLKNQILPYFGKTPLGKITTENVNSWLLGFKKRENKAYQNTYANSVFNVLNVMMGQATERGLIKFNPCSIVRRLKNDRKPIHILKVDEVQKLFPETWEGVWNHQEISYAANRLASMTGMRIGEIVGLRSEYVYQDYIYICGQYGDFGYGPTKTKETRTIPLIPEMMTLLRKFAERNSKGDRYVFSEDGGVTPYGRKTVYNELHRALEKVGIDKAEVKRRGISVHAWRHFLNTELLKQGLTIEQVQSVTGHRSDRMTEWYTHLDPRDLTDVMKAQYVIAGIPSGLDKAAQVKIARAKIAKAKKQMPLELVKPESPNRKDNIIPMPKPKARQAQKQA
ncbi:tyrosine-type recombinase/integrase [Treponema primitia]|uniref:tyrosine-type recombinase/integrase n=1 Tax=Treponema primitia TaxID=88058 RepID=UPI00397EC358